MSQVLPIPIEAAWLAGDELHLCLVQTAPPGSMDEIKTDARRPMNVALVQHLLEGKPGVCDGRPVLTELLPGGSPCMVMFPEYAFGSGDWLELNALVRNVARPLVLFAGFGAARGRVLHEWSGANVGTAPQLIEAQEHIAAASRYNCAWCWVHQPDRSTVCFCLLKTFAEQRVECVEIPDLALGTRQIVIEFQDLLVATGICADLLCEQPNGWRDALSKWLVRPETDRSKQILLAGLLLQSASGHDLWQNAIGKALGIHDARSQSYPIVALANHATSRAVWDERLDGWRSQSGVFSSKAAFVYQEHLPNARKVQDREFLGVIIRRGEPCAVGGRARWSNGPVVGRFLWHAGHCARIARTGQDFLPPETAEGAEYECGRLLRRLQLPHREESGVKTEHLAADRDTLCDFVLAPGAAPRLVCSLLHGLKDGEQPKVPHTKDLCGWLKQTQQMNVLREGIECLLFLHARGIGDWSDEPAPGQMHGEAAGMHLHTLVWCSPDRNCLQMKRDIDKWAGEMSRAPLLLIVGKPCVGTLPSKRFRPERRRDIAEPDEVSTTRRESWVEPTDRRIVYFLHLDRVATCYPWVDPHGKDVREMIGEILSV